MSHSNRLLRTSALLLAGAASLLGVAAASAEAPGQDSARTKNSTGSAQPVAAKKGKGSGVRMSALVPKAMAIGQTSAVTLEFDGVSGDGAVATVRAPAGVSVARADGQPLGEIALARGQATRVELLVTAQGDGMRYLDVTTRQSGRASIRSVALKVGSGASSNKPNGTPMTTPAGEKIISMPSR
jgi:Spy/CpxP family protein refolding chaperone